MAKQTVGNPKFYIDMLSYWKVKGNMRAIGNGSANYPSQAGYMPYLVGLNPTDYIKLQLFGDAEGGTVGGIPTVEAILDRVVSLTDNASDKLFYGILGHNLNEFHTANPGLICEDANGENVFDLASDDNTLTEICNFDPSIGKPQFNGWSLTEITGVTVAGVKKIKFDLDISPENIPSHIFLGSLAFGHVYQMPHSPDLQLTMTREYDGIKEQDTKGGSTITHVKYSKASDWVALPAWELSTQAISEIEPTGVKETRSPARGRRIWDLQFSHISSSDMFSANELYGKGNPTDSDTNDNSGYSSSDFDLDGNFNNNSETDTSFVSRILDKTIGGALPFLFQPDGNNNSPDSFAICKLDQGSLDIKQVAHTVYSVSLRIREVW